MPPLKPESTKDKSVRICVPSGTTYPETISVDHTSLVKILHYLVKKYETDYCKIKDLTSKYQLVKVKDFQNFDYENIKYRRQINNNDALMLLRRSDDEQQESQTLKQSELFQQMVTHLKQSAESLNNFDTTNDLSQSIHGYDENANEANDSDSSAGSFGIKPHNDIEISNKQVIQNIAQTHSDCLSNPEDVHLTDTEPEVNFGEPYDNLYAFLSSQSQKVKYSPPDSQKSLAPTFADRVKQY